MDDYLINTEAFKLNQADFIIRLLVSLGIGAIIGLEREYSAMKEKVEVFAGIRTFIFVALLGFIAGMTFYLLSPLVYAGILPAVISPTIALNCSLTDSNTTITTVMARLAVIKPSKDKVPRKKTANAENSVVAPISPLDAVIQYDTPVNIITTSNITYQYRSGRTCNM